MHRRRFVERLGLGMLGLAAGARGGGRVPPGARRLTRIGLELYSVRDAMRRDPERTLAAVRAMGYTDVELLWTFGNFGRSPAQVRAALDREGLRAPSAHISPAAVLVGWERSLDVARMLGHETLVVPSFTVDTSRTLDDWKEWAECFNRAGEVARRHGIWLAFHNEPGHQQPLEGRVPIDFFAESTDPAVVRLQLDVGNMVMGGGDPHAFLDRHAARCWSFHLKDVVADRTRDTELGTGTVDLRRILAAIPDVDQKSFFVEQEGARDSLASAREDLAYLARLEF